MAPVAETRQREFRSVGGARQLPARFSSGAAADLKLAMRDNV